MIYLVSFNLSIFLNWLQNIFKSNFSKKALKIISASILISLLGLRYYVGTDYRNYIYIYNSISHLKFSDLFSYTETELAHTLICKITYILGFDYRIVFLIYSLLIVFFLYKIMDTLKVNKTFFMMTYLFMIFPYSFNIMRQSLSMIIIVYSFTLLFENKKIKSYIYLFLASIFHKTSLIVLPIYLCHLFIKNKKLRNLILILFYLIVVYLLLNNYFTLLDIDSMSRYSNYAISNTIDYRIIISGIIKRLPIIFLFFAYMNDFKEKNINNYTYIALFIISMIFSFLGAVNPTLNRLSLYFSIFDAVIIGKITLRKNIPVVKLLLYMYFILYFYYQFYYSKVGEIFPYKTWVGVV